MPVLRLSGRRLAIFEHALGFFDVVEMAFFFDDDLVIFVALTCQENDVTFLRVGEDALDGAAAVHFNDGGFSDARRSAVPGCFVQRLTRSARQLYIGREAGNYFVENAVRHGASLAPDGGSVRVSARRVGDSLVLQVADNGPGVSDNAPGDSEGAGVGIRNTIERLSHLHGDDFEFELRNLHVGAVATIAMPFSTHRVTTAAR